MPSGRKASVQAPRAPQLSEETNSLVAAGSPGAQRAPTAGEGSAKNRVFSREEVWDSPLNATLGVSGPAQWSLSCEELYSGGQALLLLQVAPQALDRFGSNLADARGRHAQLIRDFT